MQAEDKVVQFIILYSALALYALFKSAKRNKRESIQDKIDAILRRQDPSLSRSSTPSPHTLGLETIYTRIRNEFVHAEERKKDKYAAMREIEQNITAFEGLVAKIINSSQF